MMRGMDIQPASIDQVIRGRTGRVHHVEADVGGVAAELARIDPSLVLRFHEHSEHWSVVGRDARGEEYLVTTCEGLGPRRTVDPRVVDRVRQAFSEGYDAAADSRATNDRVRDAARRLTEERLGKLAEEVAFDVLAESGGLHDRIFVPASIPQGNSGEAA